METNHIWIEDLINFCIYPYQLRIKVEFKSSHLWAMKLSPSNPWRRVTMNFQFGTMRYIYHNFSAFQQQRWTLVGVDVPANTKQPLTGDGRFSRSIWGNTLYFLCINRVLSHCLGASQAWSTASISNSNRLNFSVCMVLEVYRFPLPVSLDRIFFAIKTVIQVSKSKSSRVSSIVSPSST